MQAEMKIGFIGGGNMASALIGGLAGSLAARRPDPRGRPQRRRAAQAASSSSASAPRRRSTAGLAACDVIVLAVKPQQMKTVAAQLRPHLGAQLLLSIAAGIRAADLSRWLGGYRAIVRSMPNTPALIGQGITGMVAMSGVSDAQRAAADADHARGRRHRLAGRREPDRCGHRGLRQRPGLRVLFSGSDAAGGAGAGLEPGAGHGAGDRHVWRRRATGGAVVRAGVGAARAGDVEGRYHVCGIGQHGCRRRQRRRS